MKTKKFPAYIIAIAHKRFKEYKAISDIFTDYLEELPHIKRTSYDRNGSTDYYIIADTDFFKILYEFEKISDLRNILGFTYYKRSVYKGNVSYVKYSCIFTFNSEYLPRYMPIPINDVEHFLIITKS